jgi:hypothetical protein
VANRQDVFVPIYPYPTKGRRHTLAFCSICGQQRTFTFNRCDHCFSLFDWTRIIYLKRRDARLAKQKAVNEATAYFKGEIENELSKDGQKTLF